MYDLLAETTHAERERAAQRIVAAGHARRMADQGRLAFITRVRRAIGGCADRDQLTGAPRRATS